MRVLARPRAQEQTDGTPRTRKVVTLDTSQLSRPLPVKAVACLNMLLITTAADVSQLPRSRSNTLAPVNMESKRVTLEVSQPATLPLKRLACANIDCIVVTFDGGCGDG